MPRRLCREETTVFIGSTDAAREIRVGSHWVRFNPEATRWLCIWLDSTLSLAENRRRRIGETRQAKARLRRIVNQYGIPPAAAGNLQSESVPGAVHCASELSWNGGKGVDKESQPAIKWAGRWASSGQHCAALSQQKAGSRPQEPSSTIGRPGSHRDSMPDPGTARAPRRS